MGARDSQDDLKATLQMTASTIGRDLLERLVLECRMLPDVWPKLTKQKQEDVIERLRASVETAVTMAVHLINSNKRTAVPALLDKFVTGKNGLQASLSLSKTCPARYELLDSQGKEVLIIVADADDHMGDLEGVKGEEDQRAMDLGHEYDPNGDGKGMEGHFQPGNDDNVVDVIAIEHQPLDSELDQAYRDGWWAYTQDVPKDDCPTTDHRLVAQWTQGWTDAKNGTQPRVDPFVRKEGEAEGDEAAVAGDASQDLDTASDASASTQDDPVDAAPEVADAPEAKPAARKASAKKSTAKKGGRK